MSRVCFTCCNVCFESKEGANNKFYVSSCYHVFCAGCLNNKNFCRICQKKQKILPIDANLPKEVKNYFDQNAYEQQIHTIVKIQNFQEAMVKNYAKKQYPHRKQYFQTREKRKALADFKHKIIESAKREKVIVEKLKDAHRSQVISPGLFQLRSPAIYAEKSQTNPRNEQTLSITPSSSTPFQSRQGSTIGTSSNLIQSNYKRGTQIQSTQRTNVPSKLINEARKGIIAHTLRDMNQANQDRSQSSNARLSNFRNMII